ncbi:hypothetical protein [Deinococcus koreensis]|uniref:Uncharacterized protein n=1 Tax=Deinococcus koreensis TaxID=2054903 RepID=A0A2K3V0T6_9DEIO|nr:hypothetical protein [Deinococcus koreensis]PNY82397.1 hypothetical protein CVO96_14465 [Deinococcus koreensis]
MRRPGHIPLVSPLWQARLAAWPGLLTLLSVLAVVLGTPTPTPEGSSRLSASNVAPALPELRAAPQPAPATPLQAPPAPEPFRLTRPPLATLLPGWFWVNPVRPLDLAVLGRHQTDGG